METHVLGTHDGRILDFLLQIWARLCAFTLLAPPALQPALALDSRMSSMSCFWPRLPSDLSLKRARSSSSAPATAPRFTDVDSPDTAVGIVLLFQMVPGSSACVATTGACARSTSKYPPAFVRWQTFVALRIMHHLFSNSCPTLVLVKLCGFSHELRCQNTLHSQLPHGTFSSLPS